MRIGFIGLGNVGGKLAGSLLRNGFDLTVRDLDREVARPFLDAGAHWGKSPAQMMEAADAVITCLPTPPRRPPCWRLGTACSRRWARDGSGWRCRPPTRRRSAGSGRR